MKLPDDTMAAVLVLGALGLCAVLTPWSSPGATIAHDIAIGLVGFLAKAVITNPPNDQGPNP